MNAPNFLIVATAAAGGWTLRIHSMGIAPIEELSCPTSKACYYVISYPGPTSQLPANSAQAELGKTIDGGTRWTLEDILRPSGPAPRKTAYLSGSVSIVCSAIKDCLTTDCWTTTDCLAGDLRTSDGGKSWNYVRPSAGPRWHGKNGIIQSLSCPTVSRCIADIGYNNIVGSLGTSGVISSSDGMQKWRFSILPPAVPLSQTAGENLKNFVSCISALDCIAAGNGVETTVNGGATWQVTTNPAPPPPADIKYPLAQHLSGYPECTPGIVCALAGNGNYGAWIGTVTGSIWTWKAQCVPGTLEATVCR